ncbi:MFS transporter [Acidianus manzaensis]|nr:MFS transporter [Acidianus manzaensis]
MIILALLPWFLEAYDSELYFFASPYIVNYLHISSSYIGITASLYAAGIAIFSFIGGYLFDKVSPKYVIVTAVALFTIFTILTGYVSNETELLIYRFLVGVGIGIFQPATAAFAGDLLNTTRALRIGANSVAFGIGLFVAPYVISPFLPKFSFPFLISGILSIISLALFFYFVPVNYREEKKESINLKRIINTNTLLLSLVILSFGIALFGFLGYYSDYLLFGLKLSQSESTIIASMNGLGELVFLLPIALLSDKISRKLSLIISSIILTLSSIGLFVGYSGYLTMILLTIAWGAGYGGLIVSVIALSQDLVPDEVVGSVTGFMFLTFNIGAIVGGPIMGSFISSYGFEIAGMLAIALPNFIALLISIFVRGKKIYE